MDVHGYRREGAAAIAAVPRLAGCGFTEVHACSSWWTGLVFHAGTRRYEFTVGNVGEIGAPMFRILVGDGRVEPEGGNTVHSASVGVWRCRCCRNASGPAWYGRIVRVSTGRARDDVPFRVAPEP